jgi:hypothetical protein
MRLHLVHGGIENGDKDWLERAAHRRLDRPSWIAPKSARVGDEVVVFVAGHGFFATARIKSDAKRRPDWKNRWGAGLTAIELINPPISLAAIRSALPKLKWANYLRSIATVPPGMEGAVRDLIARRRKTHRPDVTEGVLMGGNLAELYRLALRRREGDAYSEGAENNPTHPITPNSSFCNRQKQRSVRGVWRACAVR